jgi:hypothetical protein
MKFAVESWDPSYGSAVETLDLDQATEKVDAAVEVPLADWKPVGAGPDVEVPDTVLFVDGVRRIDARVWISDDGTAHPGVCATVAAGLVRTSPGRAEVVDTMVMRGLYATPGGAGPIVTRSGTYDFVACAGDTPEDIYLAIHGQMTDLERRVSVAAGLTDLQVVDGPLRGRNNPNVVGYVKSQHVQYLEADQQRILGLLAPGERTPLFVIGGRQSRYSWYLRLPGPRVHPLSGIVRCEAPALDKAAPAAERATSISVALQRFASEPHKDTRAPQNLYPIAGLENELRRRLGDANLMERALRVASRNATS